MKKKMKIKLALCWKTIVVVVAVLMLVPGCEKDDDTINSDITRANYIGVWTCQENSTQYGNSVYEVQLVENKSNTNEVFIVNFFNLGNGQSAIATIKGGDLLLPQQSLSTFSIFGDGILIGKKTLDMQYFVNNGTQEDLVSATYSKQ